MIKVLNVTSDKNIGGAGRCILTFLRNYDRSKFEVKLVLPEKSALIPYVEKTGTPYIEAAGISDTSYSKEGTAALKEIFKREKPDLVHTHASFSARLAAKMLRIPVVYTRHSVFPNPPEITHGFGKIKNGWINNLTANRIIAVAGAAKDNLTEAGVSGKKITVIPNGVDAIKQYSEDEMCRAKKFYGLSPENFVFAMIARVEDIKGHTYFLQAAEKLKDKYPNTRFYICGTGSYANAVKDEIRQRNLSDCVMYLGHVQDVTSVMNIIDVNVNCSYGTEATSLSLLEGMSVGKPIIASDYGGNPELVKDGVNGLLFQSRNADELSDKMERILNDESLYARLSDGAKRLYETSYTAEIMTKNIEEIYEKTAGRKRK